MRLTFIDPADCGCTDCIVGEAVPLSRATARQIRDMLTGRLVSRLNSDTEITISLSITLTSDDLRDGSTYDELSDALDHSQLTTVQINDHSFDI